MRESMDDISGANEGINQALSQLVTATTICLIFMVGEVIGGYLAGSLAIMTDAAHLLSDVAGFVVSLVCLYLTKRKPTAVLSFGFKRAEVLGALLSVSLIWVVTGLLIVEAVERTTLIMEKSKRYEPVNGRLMFIIACFGLLCNLIILKVLGHTHSHGGGGIGGGHGHSHDDTGHGHSHSPRNENHGHSHDDHGHSHDVEGHHGHSHAQGEDDHTHGSDEEAHGEDQRLINSNKSSDTSSPPPLEDEHEMNGLSIRYSFVSADYGTMDSPNLEGAAPVTQHRQNLNVEAAYIHAVGDFLQSMGVIIAGALIWMFPHETYPMMQLCDPFATFFFSILVLYSTFQVLKTSVNVLMEGVPAGLEPARIKRAIERLPGVLECHDLHIWSLSLGNPYLSVHVVLKKDAKSEVVLQRVHELLYSKFRISHATVQVETDTHYTSGNVKRNADCHAYEGDDV